MFELRHTVVKDFCDYVESFLNIRDPQIAQFLQDELDRGALWPDPPLQLNPTFETAGLIDTLIEQGKLDPRCGPLFRRGKSDAGLAGMPLRLFKHMDVLFPACAGVDVHQKNIVACRIYTGADGQLHYDKRTFAGHLASWLGLCPGNTESGGKRLSGRTRKGNVYARAVLVQMAHVACRMPTTQYWALYRRIMTRRGKKRALIAVSEHQAHIARQQRLRFSSEFHDRLPIIPMQQPAITAPSAYLMGPAMHLSHDSHRSQKGMEKRNVSDQHRTEKRTEKRQTNSKIHVRASAT